MATATNYFPSGISNAAYTIRPLAAAPSFSVPAGTYSSVQTVTISDATSGASIYFTTDGSTPTTSSTLYANSITVSSSETLQAIAAASGYANSTVSSASYTVNLPVPTFTFGASAPSLTVNSGAQGTTTLTVTPQNGFNAAVSFACSGLPANATCSFSPTTVTPSGAAATTLLTIAVSAQATMVRSRSSTFLPETGLALAGCLFFWKRRRVLGGALLVLLFSASAPLLVGCGGGGAASGGGGSSPQSYSVNVTATSGSLHQTATVTLTEN